MRGVPDYALFKERLLKKANVHTFADFTGTPESDIEDLFGHDFYVEVVNAEFLAQLATPIEMGKLVSKSPRILERIELFLGKKPHEVR